MLNRMIANKVTLIFVFTWFTLVPVAVLSLFKYLFNFGFIIEFPLIVIMEMFMFSLWVLMHKRIPSVKAEIMCNDKYVIEGTYDFKGHKGEGE